MLRRVSRNMGRVRVMGADRPRPADRYPSSKPGPIATRPEPTYGPMGSEELAVLWVLADYYNDDEGRTFVGAPRLGEQSGLARWSVERSIESLIARGVLVDLGKRRMSNGHQVRTFGLSIPDDMTRRRDMGHDASNDAPDDASHDASHDAKHGPQPAAIRAERKRTEKEPGCWELERCVRLDLERDPSKPIRSSREGLERKVAGDYAPIIQTQRQRRIGLGLPRIEADDELAQAWIEYLIHCRKPEATRLGRDDLDRLFPKPPCPYGCDRNGFLEPDPDDPEQRMRACPTCRP